MVFLIVGYLVVLVGLPLFLWWLSGAYEEKLVKKAESELFGEIRLMRTRFGEIYLRMCGVVQGVDARTFVERSSYWHKSAELITEKLRQKGVNCGDCSILYLGLGGGTIPWLVNQAMPGVRQVVVEIEHQLVKLVREDFGLQEVESIEIVTGDAFELLKKPNAFGERFDLVLVDVFSDFDSLEQPMSATKDFLERCAVTLRSGGYLMVNQPNHTKSAVASVVRFEELLQGFGGRVEKYEVDDRKRGFKNAILMVKLDR